MDGFEVSQRTGPGVDDLFPLNRKAVRIDQIPRRIERERPRPRVADGAGGVFDHEKAVAVDGEIHDAAGLFGRPLIPAVAGVPDPDAGARDAGFDRLVEQLGKRDGPRLETGRFDIGDVVSDDTHGKGVGVEPGNPLV